MTRTKIHEKLAPPGAKRKYDEIFQKEEEEKRRKQEAKLAKKRANAEGKEVKAALIADSKKVSNCIYNIIL